jgi:hypothetical protein
VTATHIYAADASAQPTKFSEPRNAAATFVGAINFSIGRLGSTCAPILGEAAGFPKALAETWRSQNAIYYTTSINYFTEYSLTLFETKGSAAIAGFQETLHKEFEKTGNAFVEAQVVGSKKQKTASCKALIEKVKAGGFNITDTNEFFATLGAMSAEFK